MMPSSSASAGEKIAVGVEKIWEGIKRVAAGLIFSIVFLLIPGWLLSMCLPYGTINMWVMIQTIIIISVILALLCGLSIRFLVLMCSLSIAWIPAIIIALVVGYYFTEQTLPHTATINFWVAVPVYIILLLLIFPWIWIYALYKEGLISKKPVKNVVETVRNEFVDTGREIKRFGRRE